MAKVGIIPNNNKTLFHPELEKNKDLQCKIPKHLDFIDYR